MIGRELAASELPDLSPERILGYHKQALEKLPPKEGVTPGEIRTSSVTVGAYLGEPAQDCSYLLETLCTWINGPDFRAPEGRETAYAILQAVVAHLYIAWIHPFGDGNGRTARLVEFHLLLAAGVPSPAAHLLSNHYNKTRDEYYRQLDQASKSGGEIAPFVLYAIQGLVEELREQLSFIWDQQWDVVWRNYVHELFANKNSPADTRQRHLALDLGTTRSWIAVGQLPEMTPRLAKTYAAKTPKTVQRDSPRWTSSA